MPASSLPPSAPEHSFSLMAQAPVGILEIGLMHGTHNSPSPQPSCPSSADCGLVDTSGMHFDKHTPAALPTDEVQAAGLKPPPAWMIGSGRHTLCPSGHAVMALASAGRI